jgi:hypothetical protein
MVSIKVCIRLHPVFNRWGTYIPARRPLAKGYDIVYKGYRDKVLTVSTVCIGIPTVGIAMYVSYTHDVPSADEYNNW